jgi:uncharacterized membrane protein YccC
MGNSVGRTLDRVSCSPGRHFGWQEDVKLWNALHSWTSANAVALRLCLRMTVAGLLAYALTQMFTLAQGYWSVFSAIIIMQSSVGGSVKATIDRVIGTIGGAVTGGAVAYLLPTKVRCLSASHSSSRSCR